MLTTAVLAIGLAGVCAAPAHAAAGDWTQQGYSPQRSHYNPDEPAINARTINRVRLRWSVQLKSNAESCFWVSPPVVTGGRVFVNGEGGVSAYVAGTGRRLWHRPRGLTDIQHLAVVGSVLLASGANYCEPGDGAGELVAVDAATGRLRWRWVNDARVDTMLVDRGLVVIPGATGARALRVSDGRLRWTKAGFRSWAVAGGGRLLGSSGRLLKAVDVTTGRTLWSRAVSWRPQAANPAGDRFYAIDGSGTLICVRAANGAVVWRARSDDDDYHLATDGRRVYRTIIQGVEALDARTGRSLWQVQLHGPTGQPVRAGGLVYAPVDGGEAVGILHAATGRVASTAERFGSREGADIVVSGGRVYISGGEEQDLRVFGLTS
ncbi:PQQ-binding-like beta-propeller repeat protein [Krasilnikovia sp. M28-CT-15]|uniref:outer membrane protein assembly factor BamB family protein n=1 Tax=Krasilnikovia sp. M28-CT-15 TaxID=3373540 RepID=UPI0038761831